MITLSTPAGDIAGSVEILNAAPNKSRSVIKADVSALGAGQLVRDQRFDGNAGYVMDTLQGNQDITGNQLDNLRNGAFPHPFLNYKEMGATVQLGGKEKVGEREAYALIFDPKTGAGVRRYIDAESYLPIKLVVKVDVPQLGREVEQNDRVSRLPGGRRYHAPVPIKRHVRRSELHDQHHQGGAQRTHR